MLSATTQVQGFHQPAPYRYVLVTCRCSPSPRPTYTKTQLLRHSPELNATTTQLPLSDSSLWNPAYHLSFFTAPPHLRPAPAPAPACSSLRKSCSLRVAPHTLHSSRGEPGAGGAAVPKQPGRAHMYLSRNRRR